LHRAASQGNKVAVEWLLDQGADINAKDKDGKTPLFEAGNSKDVAEILRQHGAVMGSYSDTNAPIQIRTIIVPR
jgi:ankyrin repeat protein